MNSVKKLLCAAAVALGTTGSAIAAPVLTDWVFSPNGGGFAGGQTIGEYLDTNGNAFIQLTPTGGNSFEFREHAVFNILQADSNGRRFPVNFPGGNISATFEAVGSGTYGGEFSFSSGIVRMYQNPVNRQYGSTQGVYGANLGTLIAEFDVFGGGGRVDANGAPINNGQVSVFAKAMPGMLEAGYFFNAQGEDLSTKAIMGFAFTNANTISRPGTTLVSEVACQYAGFTGNGCTSGRYSNRPNEYFFIGGNGQFKLGEILTEVPEPGSFALFGIALLAAGATARKRRVLRK
ncbi:flocculation-associated PEP-CTERM protein PepA [Massilia sp. SYSU DXS3249]